LLCCVLTCCRCRCCGAAVTGQADPSLASYGKELVVNAARQLRDAKLAVFDERSGNLYVTELGRVASHFYIR
jgi:activating signal cointegrator complex subunit 3